MKRNHLQIAATSVTVVNADASTVAGGDVIGKDKSMYENDDDDAGGVDELLAMLGYKVKSSDMVDVAQKIESKICELNPSDLFVFIFFFISGFWFWFCIFVVVVHSYSEFDPE
ncbi:hypothetical protein QVD17_26306 [Tagetes erecta]|uniref:Transcriptional factor DELLA N-terminal domain-containing protein n=1 Tax=Tagetes erecta TaxID=13708 RepID=A0AAD8NQP1_TARER|nr:hypothetical protein QVD17_30458 [Tagetes erecta]KAK1417183.1 hypothetical protein QVD17_26306 [Tagetes erecta]